jgi:hypothetical protein
VDIFIVQIEVKKEHTTPVDISFKINKPMAPTILEKSLPICGLRPNHVCETITFSTPHIGHSRHGLFFKRWIMDNLMLNLLTYPGPLDKHTHDP